MATGGLTFTEYHAEMQRTPLLIGKTDEWVRERVPRVQQRTRLFTDLGQRLFVSGTARGLRGAMWVGVPRVRWSGKASDGVYVWSTQSESPRSQSDYCRVMEGPENQVWFAPTIWDRTEELTAEVPASTAPVRSCYPSASPDSPLCTSTVLRWIAHRLQCDPTMRARLGLPFEELAVYDLAKENLVELGVPVQVIEEMVGALRPDWREDRSTVGRALYLDLTGVTMALTAPDRHLRPRLSNIVVPPPVFRLIQACMEAGVPPLVPMYTWFGGTIFNGPWTEPCPGTAFNAGDPVSTKVLAGMVNKFNTELVGGVSMWPFGISSTWITLVCKTMETLLQIELPGRGDGARGDLSLHMAQKIPCVIEGEKRWHVRVLDHDFARGTVQVGLTDIQGKVLAVELPEQSPDERRSGMPDGEEDITAAQAAAGLAADPPEEEDTGGLACYICAGPLAEGSQHTCPACDEVFCQPCMEGNSHTCDPCSACESLLEEDQQHWCEECDHGPLCGSCCHENTNGGGDLCESCANAEISTEA